MPIKGTERSFFEIFSGCGGLSLGFLQAGYKCLLALDNDPQAVKCYNQNLKGDFDNGAYLEDLSKVLCKEDVINLLAKYKVDPKSCDVLIGGPPCQSFSIAGKNKIRALMESEGDLKEYWRKRNRKRAMLFEVYALFLEVLSPKWFLFENVPAIQSHKLFEVIINRFNNLITFDGKKISYKLFQDIYIASKYGVPQQRKRFVLVGQNESFGFEEWIKPKEKRLVTVGQALNDLPEISSGHSKREVPYFSQAKNKYQRLMRFDNSSVLINDHICRSHNDDDIALFKKMKQGSKFADDFVQKAIRKINPKHKLIKYSVDKFKDKLHKLMKRKPSWTVTAHLQKDCYKFIHFRDSRTISVREAARLQSFPDRFKFSDIPMGSAFRLIGNSVPPLMSQAFAESFIETEMITEKSSKKIS